MTDFGFKKGAGGTSEPKGKRIDVSGLPTGPVALDPNRERDAVERGEALGFTDRGQGRGGRRKRPAPPPSQTLYIRAPKELAEWFEHYTEQRGHRAFWQSLQDFRGMIEASEAEQGRASSKVQS